MRETKCPACNGKGYHMTRTGRRNKVVKQPCSWCRGNKKMWRTDYVPDYPGT